MRIDYPTTLMWRGMWAASYLALAVIFFGWVIPVNARSSTANNLWHDVDGPWRSVENQLNDWFVGLRDRVVAESVGLRRSRTIFNLADH